MHKPDKFWLGKSLSQLTRREWESLCDRCGRCCMHKRQDPRTGRVVYSRMPCRHLNLHTRRCSCYRERARLVPECLDLYRADPKEFRWLPPHCAYRRLSEGRGLPSWHPLLTGAPASARAAGRSVKGRSLTKGRCRE